MPAPRRPKTGRHIQARALLALIISHPALFADYAEQLAMLDFHDEALDGLKNTVIDLLLSAPDLDAAALKHHLETDIDAVILDQLFGADMTARFGGAIDKLDEVRVRNVLDEMMTRLARTGHRG